MSSTANTKRFTLQNFEMILWHWWRTSVFMNDKDSILYNSYEYEDTESNWFADGFPRRIPIMENFRGE